MRPLLHAIWVGSLISWPIALAFIDWKIAELRGFQSGAFVTAARAKLAGAADGLASRGSYGVGWPTDGGRSSGNSAFDEWRAEQLAQFENERRKLEATHREFAEFVEDLRRARDREEFDRFINTLISARHRTSDATPPHGADEKRLTRS